MADITNLLGGTLIFTIAYGVFAFLITCYSLYLNYKQARVNEQMKSLLSSVQHIENMMLNRRK